LVQVHDTAIEPPEFCRWAVGFDLEFLDRVDVRKERHLSRLGLQHRDPVEQILVRARPAAVDARQRRAGRQRHSRRQPSQRNEAAAIQRQVYNLSVIYHLTESGTGAAKERRVGGDHDRVGEAADLESEVQPHRFAGRQLKAIAAQRTKSVQRDGQPIGARGEGRHHVAAVFARDRRSRKPGCDRDHGHDGAGQNGAILVGHRPDQAACSHLRVS
jgi:hypothetical protein